MEKCKERRGNDEMREREERRRGEGSQVLKRVKSEWLTTC